MTLEVKKTRSAQLFNYLLIAAAVNVFAFMGTAFYMLQSKKKLQALKDSDSSLYSEKMNQMYLIGGVGFGIAILAVIGCILVVLKRGKLLKEIHEQELEELEGLDIK